MKLYCRSSYLLVLALVALAAGVVNYFLFNPHIVLFHWLGIYHPPSFSAGHSVPGYFFRNHFSDALWCTALCLVTNFLSLNKYVSPRHVFVLLSLPFLSEIGQYFAIVPGTFDWFDLLTYLLVITIYNSISSLNLIPVRMKKIRSHFVAAAVAVVFLVMVFASATQRTAYRAPQKLPCVTHTALNYSPVL